MYDYLVGEDSGLKNLTELINNIREKKADGFP